MKKLRSRFASDEISGFLDQGTSVTGELQFSGTLRVDGDFHGSISTKDKLIVGERAQIHADIKVGEIEVYGAIFGNVESARRVQIHYRRERSRGRTHTGTCDRSWRDA